MPRRRAAKTAECYVGGVKVADLYDVTVEESVSYIDSSAHGDDWEASEPDKGSWKVTARRYQTTAASVFLATVSNQPAAPDTLVAVIAYSATGQVVFNGNGWAESATWNAPKGEMQNSELVIRGDGAPVAAA